MTDDAWKNHDSTWSGILGAIERWDKTPLGLAPRERRIGMLPLAASIASSIQADALVLAFGSIGRGEPARDIDLLVVVEGEAAWRDYRRASLGGSQWDLNVATSAWLATAHLDLEWGYCISESTCLHSDSESLESEWKYVAAEYASLGQKRLRTLVALEQLGQLEQALDARPLTKRTGLGFRLRGEEILRLCGSMFIGVFGERPFSHSSYVEELRLACEHAGLDVSLWSAWCRGLAQDQSASARESYSWLRRQISTALRSSGHDALGFDPAWSRVEKLAWLEQVQHDPGFEEILERCGLHELLPEAHDIQAAMGAVSTALKRSIEACSQPRKRRTGTRRPVRDETDGLRWREVRGGRLKVVLSGAGCSTPTCTFCDLAQYSNSASADDRLHSLEAALSEFGGSSISLYNDGSLLAPTEVAPQELHGLMDTLRSFSIEELRIESTPRHITQGRLRSVMERSGVRRLTVAMGLQTSGDWIAMNRLGRPDSDYAFRQAIETIHDVGAMARVYLLWDAPSLSPREWEQCFGRSLCWADHSGADVVSICPFTSSLDLHPEVDSLCRLRAVLSRHTAIRPTVEFLSLSMDSCGQTSLCGGCSDCVDALVTGSWRGGGACVRGIERLAD